MSRSPGQHVLKKPTPLAVQANHPAATDAVEDLVLTLLAAVSRQLNGVDSPIQSYLHKQSSRDLPGIAHTEGQIGSDGYVGSPIPPHICLNKNRDEGETTGKEKGRHSGGDLYDCSPIPVHNYLYRYGYGGALRCTENCTVEGGFKNVQSCQKEKSLEERQALEQEQF